MHIHLALQELIARECNPSHSCVLTIGQFEAGTAANIIPDTCLLYTSSAEELEDEEDFDLLEERLLNYPALAIAQCHRVMNGMSKKVRKNVNRAMNLLNDYEQDKFNKVQRKENLIDKYESRLGEYLCLLYTSGT